jgi:hypothetical protein
MLLIPDSQLHCAVQADLFSGSTHEYVSVSNGGQTDQDSNDRACNQAPNGRVQSQCPTSSRNEPDRLIQHLSPSRSQDRQKRDLGASPFPSGSLLNTVCRPSRNMYESGTFFALQATGR